jgi:predicted Fe-S protein YdhL (DUF1289 family)
MSKLIRHPYNEDVALVNLSRVCSLVKYKTHYGPCIEFEFERNTIMWVFSTEEEREHVWNSLPTEKLVDG